MQAEGNHERKEFSDRFMQRLLDHRDFCPDCPSTPTAEVILERWDNDIHPALCSINFHWWLKKEFRDCFNKDFHDLPKDEAGIVYDFKVAFGIFKFEIEI